MRYFKKNDISKAYNVVDGKVVATIEIGGVWVANPTLETFLADGWVEYIPSVPTPILPTLEELVECKIRERYSINQEFQVNRKREVDVEAFNTYNTYVEECIAWAENQPHRDE